MSFLTIQCFRTFAVWKHFRFIPPQVVGGLVRPASPLFLPPTCHRQDHGGNPSTMPVPMGNVLVRCRLYGSVYLVQHGKQQATLTLHQSVCAIIALDHLKSFSPYPIRIRTIGKVRPMEADFQGVPFSSFISHRQHPLRMGFPHQLRPLPSPLPTHLRHRVLHPPHLGISDTKHHRHLEQHTFSQGQRIR